MAASTVLVIVTLAAEASAPATSAAAEAVRASLGARVEVRVEPNATLEEAPKSPALEGFVTIRWESPEHQRARLLCYVPAERRWVDREIAFHAGDPELERGRALGFVIASIYADAHPEKTAQKVAQTASRAPVPHDATYTAAAAAALTAPGDSTAFGAWLGVERRLVSRAWLGLFTEARFGSVPAAQATTRFLGAGVTGNVDAIRFGSDAGIGVRLSFGIADTSVEHLSSDDPAPDRQHRVLPGGDLLVEVSLRLAPSSTVWLGAGASAVAGSTEVVVHGRTEATLPAVSALVRLGLRTDF